MKKKIMIAASGTFLLAALGLSGLTTQASTVEELRSKATDYCTPKENVDCKSGATGNIYSGYAAESA